MMVTGRPSFIVILSKPRLITFRFLILILVLHFVNICLPKYLFEVDVFSNFLSKETSCKYIYPCMYRLFSSDPLDRHPSLSRHRLLVTLHEYIEKWSLSKISSSTVTTSD